MMSDPITLVLLVAVIILMWLLIRRGRNPTDGAGTKQDIEKLERSMREELARWREESTKSERGTREELSTTIQSFTGSLRGQMKEIADLQRSQLDSFSQQLMGVTKASDDSARASRDEMRQMSERIREAVETRLAAMQDDNSKKLEQMRATVDEKLHATLEARLGQSFKIVSERLEAVKEGLGEMRTLAAGVGDLKSVLTNVKARGVWGEVQLGAILEQILTPDQYAKNVATKLGSNDRVEFAIKLPGRDNNNGKHVWLPIDAKFPLEDYQQLVDAQEQANPGLAEEAGRQLEVKIRNEGKKIREKYLDPPRTTDFAIMFLPTEGLYAEVLRRPGLADTLQREHRVTIAGPTTLAAILNSLQMGFRTLAIEKRSSEVWALLGSVKTEFTRFGDILDRTRKKLTEASNTIDDAAQRSRSIERQLREVQELPASVQETLDLLPPSHIPE